MPFFHMQRWEMELVAQWNSGPVGNQRSHPENCIWASQSWRGPWDYQGSSLHPERCHGDSCQQEPTGSLVGALTARPLYQTYHPQPFRLKHNELFSQGVSASCPKGWFILASTVNYQMSIQKDKLYFLFLPVLFLSAYSHSTTHPFPQYIVE